MTVSVEKRPTSDASGSPIARVLLATGAFAFAAAGFVVVISLAVSGAQSVDLGSAMRVLGRSITDSEVGTMVTTALVHAAAVALAVVTTSTATGGRRMSPQAVRYLDLFAVSAVLVTFVVLMASIARLLSASDRLMAWLSVVVALVALSLAVVGAQRELLKSEVDHRLARALLVQQRLERTQRDTEVWAARRQVPWWVVEVGALLLNSAALLMLTITEVGRLLIGEPSVVVAALALMTIIGIAGSMLGREFRFARVIGSRERWWLVLGASTVLSLMVVYLLLTSYIAASWPGASFAAVLVLLPLAGRVLWAQRKGALTDPIFSKQLIRLVAGQAQWVEYCEREAFRRVADV